MTNAEMCGSVWSCTVVCAWCGSEMGRAEVREESERESRGMCQACFRRMVEEHARVAARPARAHASER